jgi:hypothetical protein
MFSAGHRYASEDTLTWGRGVWGMQGKFCEGSEDAENTTLVVG